MQITFKLSKCMCIRNVKHERNTTIVTTSIYPKIYYTYDLLSHLRNLATISIIPTEELAKMF